MSNYGNAATALDATSDPVVLRKIRMVVGPPGCGKTHYLAERVLEAVRKFGPRGVLVCSLTRTAAKEAIDRVSARLAQDGIEIDPRMVGTLHSHALRALGSPEIAETSKWVQRWNEWTCSTDTRRSP